MLYSDNKPETTIKGTGFKDAQTANKTLKLISKRSPMYQMSVVNTMIQRAKYHPNPTPAMSNAVKVFNEWKRKNKNIKTKYPFLPLSTISKYEPIAEMRRLSEVSRGVKSATKTKYGFLEFYKKVNGDQRKLAFTPTTDNPAGQDYWSAREAFLNARTAQIRARNNGKMPKSALIDDNGLPTNQHIVMIMNGYSPMF